MSTNQVKVAMSKLLARSTIRHDRTPGMGAFLLEKFKRLTLRGEGQSASFSGVLFCRTGWCCLEFRGCKTKRAQVSFIGFSLRDSQGHEEIHGGPRDGITSQRSGTNFKNPGSVLPYSPVGLGASSTQTLVADQSSTPNRVLFRLVSTSP